MDIYDLLANSNIAECNEKLTKEGYDITYVFSNSKKGFRIDWYSQKNDPQEVENGLQRCKAVLENAGFITVFEEDHPRKDLKQEKYVPILWVTPSIEKHPKNSLGNTKVLRNTGKDKLPTQRDSNHLVDIDFVDIFNNTAL